MIYMIFFILKENDMKVDEDFVDYAQLLLSSKPTNRRRDLDERASIITITLLDVVSTAFTNNCYNFVLFKIKNIEKKN